MDGPSERVGAVFHRHGAFHDFNGRNVVQSDLGQIDVVAKTACQRHPVDHDFHVLSPQSVHGQCRAQGWVLAHADAILQTKGILKGL